ncbi:class I SAM-dependent methyltransferase [Bacillus sp. 2205SS5-2]|uniref:class I SAM-dependent methyltransferase n=1 Tax=Bacillus sp. 2205SS5-2 TaxID=3109031 RepID=UPI003006A159
MKTAKNKEKVKNMIITTSARADENTIHYAKSIAQKFGVEFVLRKNKSLVQIQTGYQSPSLVVNKNRLELHMIEEKQPFFFHPNSASFRVKRLQRKEEDPLLQAANIQAGDVILDCTLGLASDSIVFSFATGENGHVTGIEGNPTIAFIVEEGLKKWDSPLEEMNRAMRNISVKVGNYLDHLQNYPDKSVDIVYFDPMFDEGILTSDGIQSLRQFALHEKVTQQAITEAKRVAQKRVVMKNYFRSESFAEFDFHVIQRKNAKFHYGYIEL